MRPRVTITATVSAVITAGLLVTACGTGDSKEPAKNIVLNLGGQVVRLDTVDAKPKTIGTYPEGMEDLDVYSLTNPRQMPSGDVIGVQDGAAVAVTLDDVDKATVLGPAVNWFPAADENHIWAITEIDDDTACHRDELPTTARSRVRIAEHHINGRPSERTLTLPCGVEPIADTDVGIAAHQITEDRPGDGQANGALSKVVLLDANGRPTKTLAQTGTVLAAAGHRLVLSDTVTGKTFVYNTEDNKRHGFPKCPTGTPTGQGVIDPTGRWYATAAGSGTEDLAMAVVDLEGNTCHDLGTLTGLETGADIPDDISAVWSNANLILLDPSDGDVITHNAPDGKTTHRKRPVDVTNDGQVWGAGA